MPNFLAEIAILAWAPLCLVFFRLFKPVTAATTALLGSSLLLPANYVVELPGVPGIDRHVAGALGAGLGYFLLVPRRLRAGRLVGWDITLIAILTSSAAISAVANPDPLIYGDVHLPALTGLGSIGMVLIHALTIVVPFFMGSRLIRSTDDVLAVLRTFVAFGLIYFPLILWEAKMSPQLHATVYGWFPHEWLLHVRGSGYRPVVFTGSGLECGLFVASATIAAAALHTAGVRVLGMRTIIPVVLLLAALLLTLSLAPILYGFGVSFLLLATRPWTQAKAGIAMAAVVLFYPLLRSQDLFPTRSLVSAAEYVSEERAFSLEFRFENEDRLLEKASERPLFGWGGWGRNKVYDPETGSDLTVTDGAWIIHLGQFGLTGFLSLFLLLLLPIVLTLRKASLLPRGPPMRLVLGLCFLLLARDVDLIPNGFFAPITPFLAGCLMPFARARRRAAARGAARSRPVAREPEPAGAHIPSTRGTSPS